MKKGLIIALIALAGCQAEPPINVEALERQNRNLMLHNARKNEEIAAFTQYLDAIQSDLDGIKMQELELTSLVNVEENSISSDQIRDDIKGMSILLDNNREKIARLKSKITQKDGQLGEFKVTLDILEQNLEQKAQALVALSNELTDREIRIGLLQKEQALLLTELDMMVEDMNRVYYLIGEFKDLQELGVAEKSGGILGLGRVKSLVKDLDLTEFVEGDESEITEIPLFCSSATVLTAHPANSYELIEQEQVEYLKIIDPASFWSSSKHLCVVVQ